MKHVMLIILGCLLFLASCEKATEIPDKQATPKIESATTTVVLVKDFPQEFKTAFIDSFKRSCVVEAMKGNEETMQAKIERVCACGADKAQNIITSEDVIAISEGDQTVKQGVMSVILSEMQDCSSL